MTASSENTSFALALDECCERVLGGEPLESCLVDYPAEYREEMALLVPLTGSLTGLSRDPSAAFRAQLERHLLSVVDEARHAHPGGLSGRLRRLLSPAPLARLAAVALVVLVLLAGGGFGIAQAAEGSLPDSPLYQVKQAREWVELTMARDEDARVAVHDRQIARRAQELTGAVQAKKPGRVVDSIAARAAKLAEQMVDRALASQVRGNPRPTVRALAVLRAAQRRLDRLEAQAPPEIRPSLQRLRSSLDEQERRLLERRAPGRANRQSGAIPQARQN